MAKRRGSKAVYRLQGQLALIRRRVRRRPGQRRLKRLIENEAFREVLSGILIVAILYFGVQGAMFLILRTDSPMMAVVSGSMRPTFDRGDLLIVRGVGSPDDIKIGDIIVYQRESQAIVHRVVKIEGNSEQIKITTRGDANTGNDDPITFEQVRGKVLFWIPKLGYISIWFRGG